MSVNVTTTMPSNGTYEEHIVSDTNTTNFEHSISVKKYKFGPETNRTILIYIYDFQTPLKIKVSINWIGYFISKFLTSFTSNKANTII